MTFPLITDGVANVRGVRDKIALRNCHHGDGSFVGPRKGRNTHDIARPALAAQRYVCEESDGHMEGMQRDKTYARATIIAFPLKGVAW